MHVNMILTAKCGSVTDNRVWRKVTRRGLPASAEVIDSYKILLWDVSHTGDTASGSWLEKMGKCKMSPCGST